MARPPLEVADLIRAAGDAFIERNRHGGLLGVEEKSSISGPVVQINRVLRVQDRLFLASAARASY